MQSEHPPEESQAVIQRGRVLGGLEPTRAFGDARYKWNREVQERYGLHRVMRSWLNTNALEPDSYKRSSEALVSGLDRHQLT
jgi:hypothetical protein